MNIIKNFDYFLLTESKKYTDGLEQELSNLWRNNEYNSFNLKWKFSFACAIKNGTIRDEILALELEPEFIDILMNKSGGGFSMDYVYTSDYPDFYKWYYNIVIETRNLNRLRNSKVYFSIDKNFKNTLPDRIFYNDNKLLDDSGNILTNNIVVMSEPHLNINSYDVPKLEQKEQERINSTEIILSEIQAGQGVRLETKDIVGNFCYLERIEKCSTKINELVDLVKNINEQEAIGAEYIFIDKYVLSAIDKLSRNIRKGDKSPEDKDIDKEKREYRKELKRNKIEKERDDYLSNIGAPLTISEFNDRDNESKPCNDAAKGDIILFTEPVFTNSYKDAKYIGDREVLALVEYESYGSDRGQHTFSLYILDSTGTNSYNFGDKIRRKGRSIYRNCLYIPYADKSARDEKHSRGREAKNNKYWTWWNEYQNGKEYKLKNIPEWFLRKNNLI